MLRLMPRRFARLPILLYHWFGDGAKPAGRAPELGVSPDQFGRQMRWLKETGWRGVGLGELGSALRDGRPLGRRTFALTFDDAYEDFHEHALSVIVECGFPATLFAVAERVGETNVWDQARGEPVRALMGWSRLREAAGAGIEIGSHSLSHADLRSLSASRLEAECRQSRERLEDGLGRPVRTFAYPYGLFDRRVRDAVRSAGYEAACAVLLRPRDLLRSDDFALMRVTIHATKSFRNFRLRLRLAAPIHRLCLTG
jgi:peptidoglycan/xylan/chitin deacetylase (PgdA/CDA1 family)